MNHGSHRRADRRPRTARRVTAGIVAATAVLGLAGCGSAGDKLADKAAEELAESQTGGNVDINSEDGSVRVETDEGVYTADGDGNFKVETPDGEVSSSNEVPKDWPDDVPLPDGLTVTVGSTNDTGDGKQVSIMGTTTASPTDVFDAVAGSLQDWEISDEAKVDAGGSVMRSATWTSGSREVSLVVTGSADGENAFTITHTDSK